MTPEFLKTVADSAARVADTFQSLPFRADRPYDPRPVATVAAEELAVLCAVVAALDRPLVVDTPTRTEPLGVDLAGLMSFLRGPEPVGDAADRAPRPGPGAQGGDPSLIGTIDLRSRPGAPGG